MRNSAISPDDHTPPRTPRRGPGRPPVALDEAQVGRAAVASFARAGYAGTTVEDVARAAGLEKTILFRRFGTKEGVFRWAVDREAEVLAGVLVEAYDRGRDVTPFDALREGFAALVDYALSRPEGFRLLFAPDRGRDDAIAATARVRAMVDDRVEELVRLHLGRAGQPLGASASLVALMIVGAAERVAARCVATPGIDADAVVELLTETFGAGLAAVRAESFAAVDRSLDEAHSPA